MKNNILVVGALPPPSGGMETIVEQISSMKFPDVNINIMNVAKTKLIKSDLVFNTINFAYRCIKLFFIIMLLNPKVVHFHFSTHFGFWQPKIWQRICKWFHTKTIMHMHGGGFDSFYKSLSIKKKNSVKNTFKNCDKVIVLSSIWEKYYSKFITTKNIIVLPNAIDQNIIHKYKYHRAKSGCKKLLFVGRIERQKGIYELLEAMKQLNTKNIHLDIMGAFQNNESSIKQYVEENGLKDRINFLGTIQGNDRFKYYNGADVFVLPSHYEALPMTILEAMAFGLPIISTKVGSIPEVVKSENGILIEPNDVVNLKKSIELMVGSKIQKYQIPNVELVKKNFSLKQYSQKLNNIYNILK